MLIIGIDFKAKSIMIKNKSVKLKVWDTAGQERFRNITQQYYKNADGILLVYDVSDKNSFDKVREWMKQIQLYTDKESIGLVLIGNKCDVENREVTLEEGEALAKEFKLKYFETSALNNYNIEETFNYLAQEVIRIKDAKNVINDPARENEVNTSKVLEEPNKKNQKTNEKKKGCC